MFTVVITSNRTLHYITLHHTTAHYITLDLITSHHIIWFVFSWFYLAVGIKTVFGFYSLCMMLIASILTRWFVYDVYRFIGLGFLRLYRRIHVVAFAFSFSDFNPMVCSRWVSLPCFWLFTIVSLRFGGFARGLCRHMVWLVDFQYFSVTDILWPWFVVVCCFSGNLSWLSLWCWWRVDSWFSVLVTHGVVRV